MGQPRTWERGTVALKDDGSAKKNSSSSSMVTCSKATRFCTSAEAEGVANQTVKEAAMGARLDMRQQRLEPGAEGAQRAEQRRQRKASRIAVARNTSAAERGRAQVAAGQQAAHGVLHVRTAVRNRKRRWRLLAQRALLAALFKAAPQRRKGCVLYEERKQLQRQTCVSEGEEPRCISADPRNVLQSQFTGSSCIREFRSPSAEASPVAAVSSPVRRPTRLRSPRSLPPLHETPPRVLQGAAAPHSGAASAAANGAPDTASSISRASAAAADAVPATLPSDTPSAFCAQTAAAASLILNPPSFAALGVPPALIRVAATLHIERPSPIQILTLPRALRGGDLCGVAPTGTGKTLCYCWPLLQRIACGNGHAFLGLVLLPARELAVQVLEQFRMYGASLGTRLCVLLGGRDLTEEGKTLLHQAPHIVIATPGRLADNVQNNLTTMRQRLSVVEVLVLDEADMLLSDEFKEDLKSILSCLPPSSAATECSSSQDELSPQMEAGSGETAQTFVDRATGSEDAVSKGDGERQQGSSVGESHSSSACSTSNAGTGRVATGAVPRLRRQTLLFSATVSPALLGLQQQRFGDALMPLFDATAVAAAAAAHPPTKAGHGELPEAGTQEVSTQQQVLLPRLSHYYLFVPTAMRFSYLLYLLEHVPPYNRDRGIIFAGSVRQTQRLCTALEVLQQPVTSLHSIMKQRTRIACLEKFRSEVARLLVCTDVAGRGLDLPRVEFVICLDVPSKPQVYVHRTGRTARAGRKGVALTFVEPSAVRAVHRIEAYINTQLQPLPSFEEHEVLRHLNHYSRILQKAALFLNEIGFDEKAEQHEAYAKAFKELRRRKKDARPLLL